MTNEEAINIMKVIVHMLEEKYDTDRVEDAVEMAIKALEQEPCDCISREEVYDYIAEFVNHEYATDREREMIKHIIGGIQHLPSIQPKPNTDVLDKIRAEITEDLLNAEKESKSTQDDIDCGICIGLQMAIDTIDKYTAESEDKE